jgi:peptidyl-prolyl cis-trans isomerase A (cyclophilin A)
VRHTNARGTIAYARGGPGTRTTQLYINLKDNARLDTLNGFGFPAFGEVVSGMSVVDSLFSGYASRPSQDSIARQGNPYLARAWPRLDYIRSARIVSQWRARIAARSGG